MGDLMDESHYRCECRIHKCAAKILTLDGQVIATGLLKLSTDRGHGYFVPIQEPNPPPVLDFQDKAEVTADLCSHQHLLRNWKYQKDVWKMTAEGLIAGDYFEFESDQDL